MKNKEKINKIKRAELEELVNNKEVIKYFNSIKVFGSTITDNCREDSDIDLFCELKPEYRNDEDENTSYITLLSCTPSDKDIFYTHEQHGKYNKKLYENMMNGVEILK